MVLTEERVTLTERLRDAGFRTAAAVASFPLHRHFGFNQGFQTYHDDFTEGGADRWGGRAVSESRFWSSAEEITGTALAQIDTARGSKQFFWFHYFDAHAPYGGSSGSSRDLNVPKVLARIGGGANPGRVLAKARGQYDLDVGYLDAALDEVLVRLDEDREKIETHVVVVSDHGESFGEGGSVGHGRRLTPEQIVVPCFVLSPRVTPGVDLRPIGTTDLTSTILSLAGVAGDAPGGSDLSDQSRKGTPVVGMRRVFDHGVQETRIDGTVHELEALRFYALVGQDLLTGSSQGPITRNDSSEEVTVEAEAAAARKLFAGFEEQLMGAAIRGRDDEETREKLQALGYVQ
jgi:arylsulfatase A-like enzyme